MKGISLPTNTLIILIIAVIVLVAMVALFLMGRRSGEEIISEQAVNAACHILVARGCPSYDQWDAIEVNVPGVEDADGDGRVEMQDVFLLLKKKVGGELYTVDDFMDRCGC